MIYQTETKPEIDWVLTARTVATVVDDAILVIEVADPAPLPEDTRKARCVRLQFTADGRLTFNGWDIDTEDFMAFVGFMEMIETGWDEEGDPVAIETGSALDEETINMRACSSCRVEHSTDDLLMLRPDSPICEPCADKKGNPDRRVKEDVYGMPTRAVVLSDISETIRQPFPLEALMLTNMAKSMTHHEDSGHVLFNRRRVVAQ